MDERPRWAFRERRFPKLRETRWAVLRLRIPALSGARPRVRWLLSWAPQLWLVSGNFLLLLLAGQWLAIAWAELGLRPATAKSTFEFFETGRFHEDCDGVAVTVNDLHSALHIDFEDYPFAIGQARGHGLA